MKAYMRGAWLRLAMWTRERFGGTQRPHDEVMVLLAEVRKLNRRLDAVEAPTGWVKTNNYYTLDGSSRSVSYNVDLRKWLSHGQFGSDLGVREDSPQAACAASDALAQQRITTDFQPGMPV